MQEVQAICDRVLIINKGNLVADDPIEQLQAIVAGEAVVTVEFMQKVSVNQLSKINGVNGVKKLDNQRWQLTSDTKIDIRAAVFQFAVDKQLTLLEMHKEIFSVEDVFQQLTR